MHINPVSRINDPSTASIFVQIASYRDPELPRTIRSCLANATHPERLVFGICSQYGQETRCDLEEFYDDPRFRIELLDFRESLGCCWARHRVNCLYDGEEFSLQIDAHMRFAPGWDERLIFMLGRVAHDKPLLTTYPPRYYRVGGADVLDTSAGVQRLTLVRLKRDLTTRQKTEPVPSTRSPGKSRFIAAGFIFTLGRFCREVEYDPNLYFAGEEIALAARAFTQGYGFYYPNENVIWHYYDHGAPLHWSDHSRRQTQLHAHAILRLRKLLTGKHEDLGRYGLGLVRTLRDYERYAEIDFGGALEKNHPKNPIRFVRRISLETRDIETRDDYEFWVFCLIDDDEVELYRDEIVDPELLSKRRFTIDIDVVLDDTPTKYLIWPRAPETWGPRLIYDL